MRRDEPPIQQRPDAGAEPPLAELREHERHVLVVAREAAADAQRLVERRRHEPRRLRVVGEIEARIDVRLERELAQQREAEGVDRRDRDVAEATRDLAPSRRVDLREAARLLEPIESICSPTARSV